MNEKHGWEGCPVGEMKVNGTCVPDMKKEFCVLGFDKEVLSILLDNFGKSEYAEDMKALDSDDMNEIAQSVGNHMGFEPIANEFLHSVMDVIKYKKANR